MEQFSQEANLINGSLIGCGGLCVRIILLGHTAANWRKKACNSKLAIAGGRQHAEMHTTYHAGVAILTYLCDVSTAGGERTPLRR